MVHFKKRLLCGQRLTERACSRMTGPQAVSHRLCCVCAWKRCRVSASRAPERAATAFPGLQTQAQRGWLQGLGPAAASAGLARPCASSQPHLRVFCLPLSPEIGMQPECIHTMAQVCACLPAQPNPRASCKHTQVYRLTFLQAHHQLFQPLPQLRLPRHSALSRTHSCFSCSA